ncbi:disease susceptibility protein LOV1-like [Camellia sinensis]|uniref:disease susceptibility protein LOV1-like n=1 Tax=Camellia sinensis TaxID=4442 RepID=UPI001036ED31|nr:disease susceptibility protein LOV1-like [Camellia sinensis]
MADDVPRGGTPLEMDVNPEVELLPLRVRPFDPATYRPAIHVLPPDSIRHFRSYVRCAPLELLLREPESHLSFGASEGDSYAFRGYGNIVARGWYMELPDAVRQIVDQVGFRTFCMGLSHLTVFNSIGWYLHQSCLDHVSTPFAVVANASRVILTTRDSKLASEVDPWGHPLKLMSLFDEESWELFLKVVNGANHDNLNNFKVGIVRICCGLPPAIVMLGGLFSSIQPNDEWSGVIDHLSQYLGDDDQSVDLLTIVALSYHELLYVLKPCFLYLTLFPKAYEIPTQRLLQLWIAEGFIQISTTTATSVLELKVLAKAYLEELVSRNMIEIATWKEDGSPKTCQMSSFLYNVFLPKADDIGFLQIHHCNSHVHESNQIIRRLADHYVGVKSTLESHTQHLCSYVSFEAQKQAEKTAKCISGLDKLQTLRLRSKDRFGQPLDLKLSPLKDHQSLSNLYLFGVIKDGIKYLPLNLKVLTLSMSKLIKDPMPVIGKLLPQLNVLKILAFSYLGSEMRCVSGNFPKLRVLKLWMLENLVQWTLEGGGMPQLAELEIRGCKKLTKLDGLEHLPALKELPLTNMSPNFVADVKKRINAPGYWRLE